MKCELQFTIELVFLGICQKNILNYFHLGIVNCRVPGPVQLV